MSRIPAKEKPCKGTRPETRGFGCGKPTINRIYGLGKMCGCYADWLLNTEPGRLKMERARIKATKPRLDLEKAIKEKKERKSLSYYLTNTKNIVHQYVKMRDKGLPCISCTAPWSNDFQAGHFKKAELFSSLRFNENNINGQCVKCNIHLEGNPQQYELGLIKRKGRLVVEQLNLLAEKDKINGTKKWCRSELENIRNKYKKLLKEIK